MNKKYASLFAAALTGAIASQAAGSTLLGPKGQFSALLSRLTWEPGNACYKPSKPYSRDSYAMQSYRNEAQRYLACMKSAADSDARYAADVVYEGYNKAADDYIREFNSRY